MHQSRVTLVRINDFTKKWCLGIWHEWLIHGTMLVRMLALEDTRILRQGTNLIGANSCRPGRLPLPQHEYHASHAAIGVTAKPFMAPGPHTKHLMRLPVPIPTQPLSLGCLNILCVRRVGRYPKKKDCQCRNIATGPRFQISLQFLLKFSLGISGWSSGVSG